MRSQIVNGKLRHLAGWKKDRPDHRDLHLGAPVDQVLPPMVQKLEAVPPVGDQSDIGSCTANMGCEQMEFLERQGQNDVLYSRLFLYAKTRELEGTPLSEDSGAEIRDVMRALATYGVCFEQTWPYDNPDTRFAIAPPQPAVDEAAQHKALFYYRCPNLFTIKASLAQGFPVGFGFSVPDNFMSDQCAHDGILHYPSPTEGFQGGHAVMAVGYDDGMQIDGVQGAVLCQNSWGTGWGQDGFFWMPYRFFETTLADDCWTLRRAQV